MSTKRVTAGVLAALLMAAVLAALLPAGGSARPSATFKAALISDVGHFNDKSFNQSQLAGLNRAKSSLKINTLAIQSNNTSDYVPNLTTAVRKGSNIVLAAGFLLAPSLKDIAQQFPKTHIVLRKEVDLHAPGLLHRPQALHQRFRWYVDSPDAAVAHRFKPREHLLSDDVPFRLGQAHRYRHCRLCISPCYCQHYRQHAPEHGQTALPYAHRHSPSRSTLRSTTSSIAVAWLRGNCFSSTSASSTSITACGAHAP